MSIAKAFTRRQIAKYFAEFIGTAILMLAIKMSVGASSSNSTYAGFSIAAALIGAIYTFGYVSKAHFNPSVSVAFLFVNHPSFLRSDWVQAVMYLTVQFLGGIAGGFTAVLIGDDEVGAVLPTITDETVSKAFFGELVFTFILCTVILHVVHQPPNQHYGTAIGLTLFFGIIAIGDISGCCLNSAVWLGGYVSALSVGSPKTESCWIYWTAPFIGGAVAGLAYHFVFGALEKEDSMTTVARCIEVQRAPQSEVRSLMSVNSDTAGGTRDTQIEMGAEESVSEE